MYIDIRIAFTSCWYYKYNIIYSFYHNLIESILYINIIFFLNLSLSIIGASFCNNNVNNIRWDETSSKFYVIKLLPSSKNYEEILSYLNYESRLKSSKHHLPCCTLRFSKDTTIAHFVPLHLFPRSITLHYLIHFHSRPSNYIRQILPFLLNSTYYLPPLSFKRSNKTKHCSLKKKKIRKTRFEPPRIPPPKFIPSLHSKRSATILKSYRRFHHSACGQLGAVGGGQGGRA